jgi:hypothetical protein
MARQHFWTISSVLSARKAGARSDIERLLRRDVVRNAAYNSFLRLVKLRCDGIVLADNVTGVLRRRHAPTDRLLQAVTRPCTDQITLVLQRTMAPFNPANASESCPKDRHRLSSSHLQ